MKKKDRYKMLIHAKDYYNKTFGLNLDFKHLSKKDLLNLLQKNKHSCMCEWSYCCYGLYQNCWQDPVEEGIWGMTQNEVNDIIKYVIKTTAKACRKDSRILYCEQNDDINVFIITRDIQRCDYLITFTNKIR